METTKLATIEDVSLALQETLALDGAEHRALKPAERRQRAARLADLYEMRARMFAELIDRLHDVVVPGALYDVASATARGMQADRDSMRFWRGQAGAR